MEIKVNQVGFQGKKEVVYALKKTAEIAKNFEYYNQPIIASRLMGSHQELQAAQNASMKAYLDMALRDDAFESAVKEMKKSDLAYLYAILQPEKTQYAYVQPVNKFKQIIQEVLLSSGRMKFSSQEVISELFKKIGL